MIVLSARQRQCVALLATGHTDAELATHLDVSVSTVRRHVEDVRAKLGARNRTHAVALAVHHGIVTAEHLEDA